MKRLALTAVIAAALLVPFASSAQSPDPAASPGAEASPMVDASPLAGASPVAGASPMTEASPGVIGVDSQHVCLEISGPVTLLTAESLTQGIMDGTFTIVGLSDQCALMTGAGASPGASPMVGAASPAASPMTGAGASPAASPMAGTTEASPAASPAS